MDNKITNFLKERNPFYVDSDTLTIKLPLGKDRDMDFAHILGNYSTPWLFTMRGYYKEDYAMLYINDYEIPNCNLSLIQYLFAYFPTIKWIGLGCIKGEPGEYWKPRYIIHRDDPTMPK